MTAVRVLVPADLQVADLGPLSPDIDIRSIGPDEEATGEHHPTQALVLDARYRDVLVRLLPVMPRLRLVQALNAGVDWVPPLPESVVLCRAGGVHDGPVAEWAVAVILAVQKRLPWFLEQQQQQRWDQEANLAFGDGPPAEDLGTSTVLIVGAGSIGRALAARLAAFGTTVVPVTRSGADSTHRASELAELLPAADIVVLLAPATPETAGMVDAHFLARMKPNAVLVNAARGSLVDTDALVAALSAGRVRAALDATTPEPLPRDSPLWRCPNVLITPHVAGSSKYWRKRAARFVGSQLNRFAAGEPLHYIQHGAVSVATPA